MAKRVLILRWPGSAYDSLGGLLDLMAQEFVAEGFEVTTICADGQEWRQQLVQILKQGGIAFALTMSGIGAELTVDGKSIWEVMRIPLFNWNCDHPCYFPTRHVIRSAYLLHGYVFPDHARYNIRHLNPNGTAFAVHLGIPPRSLFPDAPSPAATRNGRIMFTKSGADTNEIEATWRRYNPVVQRIVFAAAEELMTRSTTDFLPALQRIAEPLGLFLDGNNQLAMMLLRDIDAYIRFRRANLLMQTVLRYPIDVFGTGWSHIDWDSAAATPNGAKFHGPATWQAMIEQLPCYLGSLSINPLIEESVHDRVFFALAAGVVPVSDDNLFARTIMPALEPYRFTMTCDGIREAVEATLANPVDALAQTENVWDELAASFSMRRSAQQIIQFVMLHLLNAPCGG